MRPNVTIPGFDKKRWTPGLSVNMRSNKGAEGFTDKE